MLRKAPYLSIWLAILFCIVFNLNAPSQTYTVLHSLIPATEGQIPLQLILSSNVLYGTSGNGTPYNWGAVFEMNTDGSGFTNLYEFTGGSDGGGPTSGLAFSNNVLYGTTYYHGNSWGTVFSLNVQSTDFSNIYSFENGTDGAEPPQGVVLSGSNLFGVAVHGGDYGYGSLYELSTNGSDFVTVHSFDLAPTNGFYPEAALIASNNALFGTTYRGGTSSSDGTVFTMNSDGTGYKNLHNFSGSDGDNPQAPLLLYSNVLYGTANAGGASNFGTIFRVNAGGSDFTNLYSFTGGSDGANPQGQLIARGNTLYGTASSGGKWNAGTIFSIQTDGSGFTNLYTFTGGTDGGTPLAGLVLNGNTLYGSASSGGIGQESGTIFALILAPVVLSSTLTKGQLVLMWNDPIYALQSTTNLMTAWSNVPNANSPYTNTITGPQRFFRLVY